MQLPTTTRPTPVGPTPSRTTLFKALALVLPLLVWVAVDLLLRLSGQWPAQDPRIFYAKSFESQLDLFVEAGPDWAVRPDWVATGDGLESIAGEKKGHQFLLPGFRDDRFPRQKKPGERRIFALGSSTTFGLGVGAEAAFPAVLEQELLAAGQKAQVINLGCAGWSSWRVRQVLPRLLTLEPDLIVVYSGHNEMLAGHGGDQARLTRAERVLLTLLDFSPTVAWLNFWVNGDTWSGEDMRALHEEALHREMGHISVTDQYELHGTEAKLPTVAARAEAARRYQENIEAVIEMSRAAGVPVVFVMPLANRLRQPNLSVLPPDAAAQVSFQQAASAAKAALYAQQYQLALESLDQALRVAPDHAATHFARGTLFARAGRTAEAWTAFQRAIDTDAQTNRIDSSLEAALAEVLNRRQVPWVDLRPRLQQRLDPAQARAFFLDHVHPTAAGHREIALELLPLVQKAL